jgi:hypothetical protein
MLICHFNNKTFKAWAFKTGLITEIYTITQFSLQQKHIIYALGKILVLQLNFIHSKNLIQITDSQKMLTMPKRFLLTK